MLVDIDGTPLTYYEPVEFTRTFAAEQTTTGTPAAYTVVDREIVLSPSPAASTTFALSYVRRLARIEGSSGLVRAGSLSSDDDQPLWDAEYDYTLVIDATILGQQMLNDPTWQYLVPQRDELVETMTRDLTRAERGEQFGPWGGAAVY